MPFKAKLPFQACIAALLCFLLFCASPINVDYSATATPLNTYEINGLYTMASYNGKFWALGYFGLYKIDTSCYKQKENGVSKILALEYCHASNFFQQDSALFFVVNKSIYQILNNDEVVARESWSGDSVVSYPSFYVDASGTCRYLVVAGDTFRIREWRNDHSEIFYQGIFPVPRAMLSRVQFAADNQEVVLVCWSTNKTLYMLRHFIVPDTTSLFSKRFDADNDFYLERAFVIGNSAGYLSYYDDQWHFAMLSDQTAPMDFIWPFSFTLDNIVYKEKNEFWSLGSDEILKIQMPFAFQIEHLRHSAINKFALFCFLPDSQTAYFDEVTQRMVIY